MSMNDTYDYRPYRRQADTKRKHAVPVAPEELATKQEVFGHAVVYRWKQQYKGDETPLQPSIVELTQREVTMNVAQVVLSQTVVTGSVRE